MTEKEDKVSLWLATELKVIERYLKEHGVMATREEIVMSAIILARRMGAGYWSFCCEFRNREKE